MARAGAFWNPSVTSVDRGFIVVMGQGYARGPSGTASDSGRVFTLAYGPHMERDERRSIDREIRAIAVPAVAALATEPLYELCDTAILGRIGTEALAGAALAIRVLAFGHAAFVFLMFGTTAAVARHHGAGRDREATRQGVAAVWLAAAVGTVAAVAIAGIGRPAVSWLGGSGTVADDAWTYLWISVLGLPAYTVVMAGVGFRRGLQDTRLPLAVAAATVALNLVLELVLVFGAGFGVGASALGTVVAKWVGAGVYLALLARRVRETGVSWRPDRQAVRSQLVVGRDLVLRTLLLLGVITAANAAAARVGIDELAGYAIAFQVWMFAVYAADGLEAAGQSLVAHRLGGGHGAAAVVDRLRTWGLRVGIFSGVVLACSALWVPSLFTDDPAVRSEATASLWWVAALQPVNFVAFVYDGILVGAGQQRHLAAAMAGATTVFALVLGFGTWATDGLGAVWASLAALMVARLIAGIRATRSPRSQLQF